MRKYTEYLAEGTIVSNSRVFASSGTHYCGNRRCCAVGPRPGRHNGGKGNKQQERVRRVARQFSPRNAD